MESQVVDMESFYLNLALDAVGLTIFGVNFEASNQPPDQPQAPIVQAVYRLLKECLGEICVFRFLKEHPTFTKLFAH